MSPENEKLLAEFKAKWIDRHVKIIDKNHPWYDFTGRVRDVEYTFAGWGMRINLDENGIDVGITKGSQIKVI